MLEAWVTFSRRREKGGRKRVVVSGFLKRHSRLIRYGS